MPGPWGTKVWFGCGSTAQIMKSPAQSLLCVCLVTELCPTLCDPMDRSPPGSSVQGNCPGKNTRVGCHFLLQGIFLTQGLNPLLLCLLNWQVDSLPTVPPEKPLGMSGRHLVFILRLKQWRSLADREVRWKLSLPFVLPASPRLCIQLAFPQHDSDFLTRALGLQAPSPGSAHGEDPPPTTF